MHLHSDLELQEMFSTELTQHLENRNIQVPNTTEEKRDKLRQSERTRTIAMWHDHSTLLGHGYILITAKVLYDTAVFKYSSELPPGSPINDIQPYIEEPEIHILGLSSSSTEDQAGLIPDRLSCLQSLNTTLSTSRGIPVQDRLLFFCGDKPAAQFERGCKQGGDFPCGTCGCHASSMDDLASCFHLEWRNLEDMQNRATKGKLLYVRKLQRSK